MPGFADQQVAISSFLAAVRQVRATGQGTPERSYYPAVSALLNGLFGTLRPLRRAITDPQGIDREFPDLGVIEVDSNVLVLPVEAKPPTVEIRDIVASAQALKYARTFGGGAVLVTNLREFAIARLDPQTGALVEEDRVVLVDTDEGLATSVTVSAEAAAAFVGMLDTACQVRGSLGDPEDVARLLAFHAGRMRDAVDATGDAQNLLEPIHAAMRDGLHIDIEPRLLVPTVVQTLVYGLFASWLESDGSEDLDWMETAYRLDVPVFADVLHAALRPQLSLMQPQAASECGGEGVGLGRQGPLRGRIRWGCHPVLLRAVPCRVRPTAPRSAWGLVYTQGGHAVSGRASRSADSRCARRCGWPG